MRGRCHSCNKFCSTEVGDASVGDITVESAIDFGDKSDSETVESAWKPGDPSFLSINLTASVERTSECCGDTVGEARVEVADLEVLDEVVLKAVLEHLAKDLGEDSTHDLEIEEEETSYVEDGDGKRDSPYTERLDVQWRIHCCGETLGEGTTSCEIDEWEEC